MLQQLHVRPRLHLKRRVQAWQELLAAGHADYRVTATYDEQGQHLD